MEHQNWFLEYCAPFINFLIFLSILVYFARKPLALFASKRKLDFESQMKAATASLDTAKKALDEIQARYGRLDSEIKALRERAESDARLEAERIVNDGKRLAEQILLDAKRMRDTEFLEAKRQLELETLRVAKVVVTESLQKGFDDSKDLAFVKKQIDELKRLDTSELGEG